MSVRCTVVSVVGRLLCVLVGFFIGVNLFTVLQLIGFLGFQFPITLAGLMLGRKLRRITL